MSRPPIDLSTERAKRAQQRQNGLILEAFDRFEHVDNRERREHKASVERTNRQKL